MKVKLTIILLVVGTLLLLSHCTTNKEINKDYDLKIKLRWVKSYKQENKKQVVTGLKWVLSYLGAMLPSQSIDELFVWTDEDIIELNLAKAGFTLNARTTLNNILKEYRLTEEYQLLGSMDIGRFVMMSFNSSDNYYAITGVEKKYDNFKQKHQFDSQIQPDLLPGQSCVTNGIRRIYVSTDTIVNDIGHIAEEGHGESLDEFEPIEFEVFDFMTNGQPRFAVYGRDGNLRGGGDKSISFAGKPSKCMWCHESMVQLPFKLMSDYPEKSELLGDFKSLVNTQNRILSEHYEELTSEVDTFRFDSRSHYLAELLYITYQHPTKQRAINELKKIGGPIGKARRLQVVDSTHHEFKFLKNVVSRKELDKHLPYESFLNFDARETVLH